MGVAQMEQLGEYLKSKRIIAQRYADGLRNIAGISLMPEAPWGHSSFWMYTVLVNAREFGMNSRHLMRELETGGIQTRPLWQPLHLSPAHAGMATDCAVAEMLNRNALSLPSSVGLLRANQERVIENIAALHEENCR